MPGFPQNLYSHLNFSLFLCLTACLGRVLEARNIYYPHICCHIKSICFQGTIFYFLIFSTGDYIFNSGIYHQMLDDDDDS